MRKRAEDTAGLIRSAGYQRPGAPMALESEAAVLGAAIRDQECLELVVSELKTEDFYTVTNQKVFNALKSASELSAPASAAGISDTTGLSRDQVSGIIDASAGVSRREVGGLLTELARVGSLRRLFDACNNASSSVSKTSSLEEVIGIIEKGVWDASSGTSKSEAADGTDVLNSVITDVVQRHKLGGGPEISTGLRDLDRALCGLRPGKMGVIAARPSMGKTALARTIGRSVLTQGYGVIEFNLEMSKEELMERELAYQAQMSLTKILRAKDITDEELARMESARGNLFPGRWWVDDSTYSISGIKRKAKLLAGRMARKGIGTGLVIVDYIQLAGENGEGREQSVAAISRGCKMLAKDLKCTVLALSQLNRSCEYRDDRRPMMSDLRESGAIEQDADWVGFVYREHMYDNSYPAEDAEFIIRKQRSGPTGTVRLDYAPKLVTFRDRDVSQAVSASGSEAQN